MSARAGRVSLPVRTARGTIAASLSGIFRNTGASFSMGRKAMYAEKPSTSQCSQSMDCAAQCVTAKRGSSSGFSSFPFLSRNSRAVKLVGENLRCPFRRPGALLKSSSWKHTLTRYLREGRRATARFNGTAARADRMVSKRRARIIRSASGSFPGDSMMK